MHEDHRPARRDGAAADRPAARPFEEIVTARLARRSVLTGGLAAAAAFVLAGKVGGGGEAGASPTAVASGGPGPDPRLLGFEAVPPGTGDAVVVPPGYTQRAFAPWGTPITGARPAFAPGTPPLVAGGNTAEDQGGQVGMHHDGMHFFPLATGDRASTWGLLAINHEYTDEGLLHTATLQPDSWLADARGSWTIEMVRKSQNAHGVSIVEVRRSPLGEWGVVTESGRNRRITANSPMVFSGPAAGHRLLQTGFDPTGRFVLGTVNNCASGPTPWATYLTCEENFNGYFAVEDGTYDAEQEALADRYGVGGDRNNWATHDPRFVVTPDEANEPNRFGWVVEIDPFDPSSVPVKRTGLGRIKHEGAFVHVGRAGRAVVYMGDDQAGEHIYKFVGARNWHSATAQGLSPLDEGTLHVARFDDDGTGEWLPLVHGVGPLVEANGFADQGDVLVKTRLAATAVGATPMDRPEWAAVDPRTGLVYCTLTNNTSSSKVENAANPRTPNRWGHIVRWEEDGGDHRSTTFTWDLFVLAGPGRDGATPDGSTIEAADAFGSPDGLWIDPDGRVWIQTDGSQPGGANNQMLVANPSTLDAEGVPDIRRFLTGPLGCEVTGITTTPDRRTMWVNVQHPGDGGGSTWPDGIAVPRSASVLVTRDDGGVVGAT